MLVTIFLALAITTASVLGNLKNHMYSIISVSYKFSSGRGTRLPVSQQEINDAMRKGTLSQLFRDKVKLDKLSVCYFCLTYLLIANFLGQCSDYRSVHRLPMRSVHWIKNLARSKAT